VTKKDATHPKGDRRDDDDVAASFEPTTRSPVRFPRDPRTMTAEEVWAVMEATPGFNEDMAEAEAELAAGRGTRYEVIRGRLRKLDS
jgi:hypothetical protein